VTAPAAPAPVAAVLLCGGPFDGQAFTLEDFKTRWHATDHIARRGGQRGPALDYRLAVDGDWHLVPAELPHDLTTYAVTALVWAGGDEAARRWRDATSAAIAAARRASGDDHDEG